MTGAGLALAFPAANAWWWAWIGLVPVLVLLSAAGSACEAALRSWLAAVGFLATLHHWMLPSLGAFSVLVVAVAGLVWIPFGLVAYGLLRRVTPAGLLAAVLVLPSMWLVAEALRSWKHLGGAWGLLGLSQWQVRPALAVAAVGGVWLLSFLLVAVNVALTAAVLPRVRLRTRLTGVGVAAALVVATVGFGLLRPEPQVTGTMRVAGVQSGDVPGPKQRLAAHLRLTRELAGHDHDVVVWGQSSVAFHPPQHPDVDLQLRRAAAETGSDLLVNVDAADPSGQITKSTYQYSPGGLTGTYVKQRLVPFGEYIPLRPLLGWVADITEAAEKDRSTGDTPTTLAVSGYTVGPLISYESTFPDMRRHLARMGADVTIVQGSLTTFHSSWAHAQQASFEAVRAVESGRSAVLVELDGTSAAFDARGRPLAWVSPDYRGTFIIDVPLSHETTPYVRLGDWVPALAAVIVIAAGVVAGLRRSGLAWVDRPVPGRSRPGRQ
ncbi:apolipoprotein N-acyltransferase [Nonomuraea sp. 3N208]|uniref:apolipoprotein N-acyltransferase n=1 Tax=Nonomuraea sp. 3N208 TaxID=3457421 RepID=UPI003FD11735